MSSKPASVLLVPMQVHRQSSWDVAAVRAALDEHEQGRLSDSARLFDAMLRDDRIAGCLRTRITSVAAKSGLPFKVEAADDSARAKAIAEEIEALWWDVLPEPSTKRVLRDAVGLGPAVGRIEWRSEGGRWLPLLRPLPAHNLEWDEQARRWYYWTRDGRVPVTPGDGNWFLFEPDGEESWMGGAVRCLGLLYAMRAMTYTDWVRYCEKHGLPIITIEEPANAEQSTKDAFYARIRKLGREGVLRLPVNEEGKGFKAGFLEPTDTSWEAFERFIMSVNVSIAIILLGQNLTTEVGAKGSYAAAGIHNVIRHDYMAGDVEPLSTAYRRQIWMPYGRYNVRNWDDSLAPWGRWDCSVPEDKQAAATTLKTLGDGLAAIGKAGLEVENLLELAARFGLKLRATPKPAAVPAKVGG
jgi:phage gp29-like protein